MYVRARICVSVREGVCVLRGRPHVPVRDNRAPITHARLSCGHAGVDVCGRPRDARVPERVRPHPLTYTHVRPYMPMYAHALAHGRSCSPTCAHQRPCSCPCAGILVAGAWLHVGSQIVRPCAGLSFCAWARGCLSRMWLHNTARTGRKSAPRRSRIMQAPRRRLRVVTARSVGPNFAPSVRH